MITKFILPLNIYVNFKNLCRYLHFDKSYDFYDFLAISISLTRQLIYYLLTYSFRKLQKPHKNNV